MSAQQKAIFDGYRDIPDPKFDQADSYEWEDESDDPDAILRGQREFEISHGGGEFHEMLEKNVRETIGKKK